MKILIRDIPENQKETIDKTAKSMNITQNDLMLLLIENLFNDKNQLNAEKKLTSPLQILGDQINQLTQAINNNTTFVTEDLKEMQSQITTLLNENSSNEEKQKPDFDQLNDWSL